MEQVNGVVAPFFLFFFNFSGTKDFYQILDTFLHGYYYIFSTGYLFLLVFSYLFFLVKLKSSLGLKGLHRSPFEQELKVHKQFKKN